MELNHIENEPLLSTFDACFKRTGVLFRMYMQVHYTTLQSSFILNNNLVDMQNR